MNKVNYAIKNFSFHDSSIVFPAIIYIYIYIYIYITADRTVSAFWASSVQCIYINIYILFLFIYLFILNKYRTLSRVLHSDKTQQSFDNTNYGNVENMSRR